MPKSSLTQQREAVEALINLAIDNDNDARPNTIEDAKQAVLTLAWLERKESLVRELARIEREAPEIARALVEWPGLQIAGVR